MSETPYTLIIAVYGALVSTATASITTYQVYRKKRKPLTLNFKQNRVKVNDEVGYTNDYFVSADLLNESESEVTALNCYFGLSKSGLRGEIDVNVEGYGRMEKIDFPMVIPAMSARTVYNFASHWRREGVLRNVIEAQAQAYKLYITVQTVGQKEIRLEIPGAGPAMLQHEVERIRER